MSNEIELRISQKDWNGTDWMALLGPFIEECSKHGAEQWQESERALVSRLSPGLRATWSANHFDTELKCGGFDGLLYNLEVPELEQIERGLVLLDASPQLELIGRAKSLFPGGAMPSDLMQRRAFIDEIWDAAARVPPDDDPGSADPMEAFDELSSEYYALEESLQSLQSLVRRYVETHPREFFFDM